MRPAGRFLVVIPRLRPLHIRFDISDATRFHQTMLPRGCPAWSSKRLSDLDGANIQLR
jgi:hypothetical protein